MKSGIFRVAAAVVLSFSPFGLAAAGPALPTPAPAWKLKDVEGKTVTSDQFKGKVVVLDFWATWCPPCREEMPALDAFYGKFHGRGVELLGVSVDRSRDRAAVIKVALTVHYPVAILADAETNGFGKPAALPVTCVIDPAGTVRAVMTPDTTPITEEALARIVTPLLPSDHPGP